MEVINININQEILFNDKHSIALGYFDGIHLGHQQLIKKTIDNSMKTHSIPSVLTFNIDPWVILGRVEKEQLITPLELRLKIFEDLGIQKVFLLNFTKEVAQLSPKAFIDHIIKPLNPASIVCGFDFKYGSHSKGDIAGLKAELYPVNVDVIDPIAINDIKISSTLITELIENGSIEQANRLLSRPFKVIGEVIHGRKQGRKIGFRTANIDYQNYLLPKRGVYAVYIVIKDKKYMGMCNVGCNPTFDCLERTSVEVHIFDFTDDIYGEIIEIEFIEYIREETMFNSVQALVSQLEKDKIFIISQLNKEVQENDSNRPFIN